MLQNTSEDDLKKIKSATQNRNGAYEYEYGPLNKSDETKLFESLVYDIIEDKAALKTGKSLKLKTRIEKDRMYVMREGEEIDLSKLLRKVNLNHVKLPQEALDKYESLYDRGIYPTNNYGGVPTREVMRFRIEGGDPEQKEVLNKLTYAEQVAINIYTSGEYSNINDILRGNKPPQDFDKKLVDIAIASQGLNKLPSVKLHTVIRTQNLHGLDEMINKALNHEIEENKGFTSAAHTPYNEGEVQIIYDNVQGVSVDSISANVGENEYLIPPSTQIKYTGYKFINGKHVFSAEGANVQLDRKHEISPSSRIKTEIDSLIEKDIQDLSGKVLSEDRAMELLEATVNINIKYGKMTEAEKRSYFEKTDRSENPNFKRDLTFLTELRDLDQTLESSLKKIALKMRSDKNIDMNDKEELLDRLKTTKPDQKDSLEKLTDQLVKLHQKEDSSHLLVHRLKEIVKDSDSKAFCNHLAKNHPQLLKETLNRLTNKELLKVQSIYPNSEYINRKVENKASLIRNIFKSILNLDARYIKEALDLRKEIREISDVLKNKVKLVSIKK
jgi:hypothetical protein